MKRIEAVITPWTLDVFKEAAPRLGISEFDLVEVYRSGSATTARRLYRGHEFTADLSPRLRVEFVVFDDSLRTVLQKLLELVHPESVAIFKLDETITPMKGRSAVAMRLPQNKAGRDDPPEHQLLVSRNGAHKSDLSSNLPPPNTAVGPSRARHHG